jgi:hypothetical protein
MPCRPPHTERSQLQARPFCAILFVSSLAAHGQDSNGIGLRSALANTQWGEIPGYVRDGESVCYFVYGSRGDTTDYTIVKGAVFSDDSNEVFPLGEEDSDEVFCAVGSTPYGRIPGRANYGIFSYSYDGASAATGQGCSPPPPPSLRALSPAGLHRNDAAFGSASATTGFEVALSRARAAAATPPCACRRHAAMPVPPPPRRRARAAAVRVPPPCPARLLRAVAHALMH